MRKINHKAANLKIINLVNYGREILITPGRRIWSKTQRRCVFFIIFFYFECFKNNFWTQRNNMWQKNNMYLDLCHFTCKCVVINRINAHCLKITKVHWINMVDMSINLFWKVYIYMVSHFTLYLKIMFTVLKKHRNLQICKSHKHLASAVQNILKLEGLRL